MVLTKTYDGGSSSGADDRDRASRKEMMMMTQYEDLYRPRVSKPEYHRSRVSCEVHPSLILLEFLDSSR